MEKRQYAKVAILTIFLLAADQISKFIVLKYETGITSFNKGIAFSIPMSNSVMIFLTPVLLLAFVFFAKKYFDFESFWSIAASALVLAGGLGNFTDRIIKGAVIDFIDVGFWPSFNLADSYLTIAAFVLILFYGKILSKHGTT